MAADGFANTRIAAEVQVSPATVAAWRERFAEDGLVNFSEVRPGRGPKPSIPAEKVEEIVRAHAARDAAGRDALELPDDGQGAGVSPATVQRIWAARGLQPHRVETFKLSNDPNFEEKLVDVVGLYLQPAREGRGAVHGREEPDPGVGPHASRACR